MAAKSIRFHPEAEREYLAALRWYRERSLVAASDFESAVSRAVQTSVPLLVAGLLIPANFEDTRCISFLSASCIGNCRRMSLFSLSLMAAVGLDIGKHEPKFEFKLVDAGLIPPRPRRY